MKTIILANQKGGVAKTTTAVTLAEAFTETGKRVLLIDADPQCNTTATCGAVVEDQTTLYDVLLNGSPVTEAVQKSRVCDIVPCDGLLASADMQLVKLGKEFLLKKALAPIRNDYDVCVIDTTPALGILLINALTAADEVVIPLTADTFSFDGLSQMLDTIRQVQEITNPGLHDPYFLLTRWSARTKLSRRCAEGLSEFAGTVGGRELPVKIRETVAVREAQEHRSGLLAYAPRSTAAEDYRALASVLESEASI